MKRREFITFLGGAAVAWPLAVRAQQAGKIARIGFLGAPTESAYANEVEGFRLGLRDLGYVEGTNIVIDYRWAEGNIDRLPELAAQLIRSNVDVIVTHGTPGGLAAKQATATIPIVLALVGDPVAVGIVASLARPGGNITGQSFFYPELSAKRIELLKELIPQMTRVAALVDPRYVPTMEGTFRAMETTAQHLTVELQQFPVRGLNEFESAFERMHQGRVEAVVVAEHPVLTSNRRPIAALATKWRLLSIGNKEFARAGGLMGYGVDYFAAFRRAAAFVDRILKGTKPADIPIEQATRFEFVINLKTAKSLGIDVPPPVLARADEVIE